MTDKVYHGKRKAITLDMVQREYDGVEVIGARTIAKYILESFEKFGIEFTNMKCSDEEYDRLEYICVLTGLITDYVYHNLQLLFAMKSIYNVNGREIITPMCELEWDFEHRGNLAINDVYSSAVCVFYRLAVDTVKASIVEVNTAKWFSWMVNDAKKLG
eukprot:410173_1